MECELFTLFELFTDISTYHDHMYRIEAKALNKRCLEQETRLWSRNNKCCSDLREGCLDQDKLI